MKEKIVKINKTESWFFEKINKVDKSLARLIKKKRKKNQINKIRNEKGEIATDNAEMQRIIRDFYEQLNGNNREGNGTPLQYSFLENPMDGGAWWAAVCGVAKGRTRLSDFTFMHSRRKWQPTPVFLPGESQGRGSLVGYRLWGCTELDTTEVTQQ